MTDTYTDNPVLAGLSPKQREVLDLVVDRRTNKEISVILGISPSAVEQRLQSVRRKLDVQGRADLARAYLRAIDTCDNSTGEEKQVSESVDLSILGGDRVASTGMYGGDSGHSGWRQQSSGLANGDTEIEDAPKAEYRKAVLDRLDAAAGLSGRLAAIATTAAAFAFMVVLVTSATQAMS